MRLSVAFTHRVSVFKTFRESLFKFVKPAMPYCWAELGNIAIAARFRNHPFVACCLLLGSIYLNISF